MILYYHCTKCGAKYTWPDVPKEAFTTGRYKGKKTYGCCGKPLRKIKKEVYDQIQ